ncbi:amidase domain-containing protein [Paenibacillus sp. J45TS6]|uniref:amidase domain-containing protein n=1 Tax=Paenibacillus sp. J45TS6 TaxID=2807196 RepID=UPI0020BE4FCE|nr:amidase domain-containing protein [Paenibacillus sp. J45TS6]
MERWQWLGAWERGEKGVEREWNHALYTYVNDYNACEISCKPHHEPLIADVAILEKRAERLLLLEQWYHERESHPVRSETRAKLLQVLSNEPYQGVVDVQLYRRLYYMKSGITHREDRIEKERLTFYKQQGRWGISSIVHDVPERKPIILGDSMSDENSFALNKPLLNRELLYPGIPARPSRYRREDAVAYADRWWDSGNPEFEEFDVNCTNYISQCLFAGGAPINYTGRRESGWWYRGYVGGRELWSFSWAVSHSLQNYLAHARTGLTATLVDSPSELQLGDVIFYDWDGDGRYQHSTIVTGFDAGGMPLVNANTVSSRHRYWDYKDSYAWTTATRYRFFHISDTLGT